MHRALVHRPIYDDFVARLVESIQDLNVGDPQQSNSDLGSLISHEHQTKVMGTLQSALTDGGRVLCGGKVPEVSEDLRETFGSNQL